VYCKPVLQVEVARAMRHVYIDRYGRKRKHRLRRNFSQSKEEQIMKKATSTLIAAVATLMLSGGVYAQSNNTLATPSTRSPADTTPAATSGYGTPGVTGSDSGSGAPNPDQPNSVNTNPAPGAPAYGGNNTLATPSTKSPAGQ
jgi:hypothetical protein